MRIITEEFIGALGIVCITAILLTLIVLARAEPVERCRNSCKDGMTRYQAKTDTTPELCECK